MIHSIPSRVILCSLAALVTLASIVHAEGLCAGTPRPVEEGGEECPCDPSVTLEAEGPECTGVFQIEGEVELGEDEELEPAEDVPPPKLCEEPGHARSDSCLLCELSDDEFYADEGCTEPAFLEGYVLLGEDENLEPPAEIEDPCGGDMAPRVVEPAGVGETEVLVKVTLDVLYDLARREATVNVRMSGVNTRLRGVQGTAMIELWGICPRGTFVLPPIRIPFERERPWVYRASATERLDPLADGYWEIQVWPARIQATAEVGVRQGETLIRTERVPVRAATTTPLIRTIQRR